jgi:hypothetical protein
LDEPPPVELNSADMLPRYNDWRAILEWADAFVRASQSNSLLCSMALLSVSTPASSACSMIQFHPSPKARWLRSLQIP